LVPRAHFDLRDQPEIVTANRVHRRLIRRVGRPAVHFAFEQARWICAEWREDRHMHVDGLEGRLEALRCEHRAAWVTPLPMPLAEWVRDRARARESSFGNCRHSPPHAEVYQPGHLSGLS
jgi:hypothetical protein